jgi:hypothetical protein
MMIWRALTAMVGLAIIGAASPVRAVEQPQCAPADRMLKALKEQYGEVPAFAGAMSAGTPFTITVSPKGTFSVLIGMDDKLCIANAGDQWAVVTADPAKPVPQSLPDAPALLEHDMLLIKD